MYSCCVRSAPKRQETQKLSCQEPLKRTLIFNSTTAAPTITRATPS